MDFMELSSQVVLQGYGQFLDGYTKYLKNSSKNLDVPWNTDLQTIRVQILDRDHTSVADQIKCNQEEDLAIIDLFVTLVKQIDDLKDELLTKHLPRLKYSGEVHLQRANLEGYHIIIGQVLPLYFEVLAFIKRCRGLLIYSLRQLVSLYSTKCEVNKMKDGEVEFISLHAVYEAVADLLLIFVAVDASIASYHKEVEPHWNSLKQTVLSASGLPQVTADSVKNLLTVMAEVQGELLTGLVFKTAVNFVINEKSGFDSEDLLDFRFNRFLDNQSLELEYVEEGDSGAVDSCARVLATFAFTHHVYVVKDKKVKKFVTNFVKKLPGVVLHSQVFWSPSDFLSKHLKQFCIESKMEPFDFKFPPYVEEFSSTLKVKLKDYASRLLIWSLKMEDCCSTKTNQSTVKLNDSQIIDLCFEGLQLCNDIKYSVICGSRFYYTLDKPVSKSLALCFCKLVELLKGAHSIFKRHSLTVGRTSHHTVQKVSIKILGKIMASKKMIVEDTKKPIYKKLFTTLCHAEKIFYQACTHDRIILVNLLPTCPSNLVDVEYNYTLIKFYCNQLKTIINLHKYLKETSVNLFGSAESDFLPLYLKYLVESEGDLSRARYVVCDGVWERDSASPSSLDIYSQRVVLQLCQLFETKLRLDALSHLNPDNGLPSNVKDLRRYLRSSPIAQDDSVICLRTEVEKYLERTWHDMLTVSLHDWRGYREMRSLARHRFDLKTVEDGLPMRAAAPGLDLLNLTRQIQTFVTQYRYNINDQTFVEVSSNNKHLNTITVDLIAGSIQTHGSGIVNTTTNFIYQFLRNQLVRFTQFIFDETFKCKLIKDYNYMKEDRKRVYTFERAEKMLKCGRRISQALDSLRELICEVGNALGLVRLVGASARQHSMNTVPFLPDVLPESLMKDSESNTIRSLRTVLEDSVRHACMAPKHLSLLVHVFSQAFTKLDSVHAPLFAVAVPPLTLCHIRHMVATKERLAKRSRTGASFADDGFILGLSYLLRTLQLEQLFDSLHWFQTVDNKYRVEKNEVLSSATSDSQENNTLKLSEQRLDMFRQEFQLLHYNLISAHTVLSSN